MRCWASRTTCAAKAGKAGKGGKILLALAVLVAPAGPDARAAGKAAAPQRVTIRLRTEARVREDAIRLSDVATISGGTKAARVGNVEIGMAPLPGRTRMVVADDVRIRLRRYGFEPAWLVKEGARRCEVTRASQTVSGEMLIAEAHRYVLGREVGDAGRIEIEPISRPRDMVLPEGRLALGLESVGQAAGSTRRVAVTARVDGKLCARSDVSLRVRRIVRVAVSAAMVQRGERLSPERVRIEERDRAVLPQDVLLEDAGWEGLQALHTIAAGVPITRRMADQPAIIHRGDTLKAQARIGGIMVAQPVVAMDDGRPDGLIRVRNIQSNREFRARVVDAKTVEVAPG